MGNCGFCSPNDNISDSHHDGMFLLGVLTSFFTVFINLQRNCDCKGGMMEEWHQKLHNNTSPDDVVICQVIFSCPVIELWSTLNVHHFCRWRTHQISLLVVLRVFVYLGVNSDSCVRPGCGACLQFGVVKKLRL